jgi:hypothetical protein
VNLQPPRYRGLGRNLPWVRSDIIVHRTDGKWARAYCHWAPSTTVATGARTAPARPSATLCKQVWPEEGTWAEFTYVWDDGKWWVGNPNEGTQTLIDLGDALLGKRTLKPAVKAFGIVIGEHHQTKAGKPHGWMWHRD